MSTILIIEDDYAVQELFVDELASDGHNVVTAGEVESISAKIKSWNPDLVVADFYIRRRHRWDVLMDIKKEHPTLPVIIAAAYDYYRNDPRLLLADGYWIKSYCFDALKEKIGEVLQRKQTNPFPQQEERTEDGKTNRYAIDKDEEQLCNGRQAMRLVHSWRRA